MSNVNSVERETNNTDSQRGRVILNGVDMDNNKTSLEQKINRLENIVTSLSEKLAATNIYTKNLNQLIDALAAQVKKNVFDISTMRLQSQHSEEDIYKTYVMTNVLNKPVVISEEALEEEDIKLSLMRGYDDDKDNGEND